MPYRHQNSRRQNSLERCFCGNQQSPSRCCGPYLSGEAFAPTAEALMRWRSLPRESRYSAFHQGNIDYLLATHQESQRQATNSAAFQKSRSTLAKSVSSNRWLNLLIINVQKGQAKDKTGVVEFVAAYRPVSPLVELTTVELASADQGDDLLTGHLNAEALQLHERSQFVKESDRWLYTEGDILAPYEPKRSEACWCGSGKKFKQCHSG